MANALLYICLILLFASCKEDNTSTNAIKQNDFSTTHFSKPVITKKHVAEAIRFTKQRHYNNAVCFFINLNMPSGKNRFFVYDIKGDSIILSGLVAHGSCNNSFLKTAAYSNIVGSGCSSTGKYKIGSKYQGRFGTSYKLHGLDSSNSNAFKRAVVLHHYDCVPEYEMLDAPICNSLGCPMVSPNFFNQLSSIIDNSEKPVLLWVH